MRTTSYKARCPFCGHKGSYRRDGEKLLCQNCGEVVGGKLGKEVEVAAMFSWNDMRRLRALASPA